MKTWNTPEVAELNINETANGIFNSCIEVWPVLDKDDKKPVTPTEPEKPVTPENPTEHHS